MKFIYLSIFLFLYSFSALGQVKNLEITYSKEAEMSNFEAFKEIIKSDDGYYSLKISQKGFIYNPDRYIDKYDKEMNFLSSMKIEFAQKEQKYVAIKHINNKFYLFSSLENEKIKEHLLFIQEIDKNTLQPNEQMKKIASTLLDGKNINKDSVFYISVSPDESKLSVSYSPNTNKNSSQEKYKLNTQVHNTISFDLLWQKEVELPHLANLYSHEATLINNFGNTHTLGKITDSELAIMKAQKIEYVLISQLNEGAMFKKYELPSEKYFTDISIMLNSQQEVVCTAFYTNDYKTLISGWNRNVVSERQHYPIDGTYFLRLDGKTAEKQGESFEEFSLEFIAKNEKQGKANRLAKKSEKGKDISLHSYYIRKVIAKEDGGAIITAQYQSNKSGKSMQTQNVRSYHDRTKIIGMNVTPSETPVQYSEDIIVVNLSPKGKTLWNEKIPLSQVVEGGHIHKDPNKVSENILFPDMYSIIYRNDKLYFIFNDNIKNTLLKDEDETYKYESKIDRNGYSVNKEDVLVLLTIDNQGKYTREILITQNKKETTHIYPKLYFQVVDNELLLFAKGKKVYRFVKFSFNN